MGVNFLQMMALERIVFEQDRLKKRTNPEVTWHFGILVHG
jgi:hypothetical protein